MNRTWLAVLLLFVAGIVQAQYKQSTGIRLGHTSGLTYKNFVLDNEALELLISGRQNGIQVTLTYVFHMPLELSFNENFFAYYGLGGHVGFEQRDNINKVITDIDYSLPNPYRWKFENKSYYVMGIDALLGIEYRWLSVPVTIGMDIKPSFNFIGLRYTESQFWDMGVSVKYIF